jgi:phage FluMu protein gp41
MSWALKELTDKHFFECDAEAPALLLLGQARAAIASQSGSHCDDELASRQSLVGLQKSN